MRVIPASVIAILVVVTLSACSSGSAQTLPTVAAASSPAATPIVTPTPTPINAEKAQLTAKSFHAALLSNDNGGHPPTGVVKHRASLYATENLKQLDADEPNVLVDELARSSSSLGTVLGNVSIDGGGSDGVTVVDEDSSDPQRVIITTKATSREDSSSKGSGRAKELTLTVAIVRSGDKLLVDAYQVKGHGPVGEF